MVTALKRFAVALVLQAFLLATIGPAKAQDASPHEIGVVYYEDGAGFKALVKELDKEGGHVNVKGKVKGAHAAIRLQTGQPQIFRMCGVDPSRYKLYTFGSSGNSRSVTIAKSNIWIGGVKETLAESEVQVSIQKADGDCFAITPKETLKDGEYGFSPAGSQDVFMFGVGSIKQGK